ncbi:MAG: carbohydrate deacetylase [Phycisphaerae bacterium]
MLNSQAADSRGVTPRQLIINADDFGLSIQTNRGIIQCRQQGVLTSASLMVRAPAASQAAHYAAGDPGLSLGLHVELGQWNLHEGQWVQTQFVVPLDNPTAVQDEIYRQIEMYRKLTGHNPSHLDSHQHVHQQEPVKGLMRRLAADLGVVLRGDSQTVRFQGAFYGQDENLQPQPEFIAVANLIRLLDKLQPGITELSCHPGLDDQLNSNYRDQRRLEVQTLCDPAVRKAINQRQIELISFAVLRTDLNLRRFAP